MGLSTTIEITMAIFQYELEILPKEFFEKYRFNLSKGLEANFAWEGVKQPSSEFIDKIKAILPFNHSWPGGGVGEYQSKDNWSSKIQIFMEGNELECITLKYSPLKDKLDLLATFVSLTKHEGYLLYSKSSQSLVKVDIEAVKEDLKKSNAFKFLNNPEKSIVDSARGLNNKDK